MNTGIEKPVAETINRLSDTKLAHHNFQISHVNHLQKVFSHLRQKLSRPQGDEMLDCDGNATIWCVFTSAITKPAVHLGQDYEDSLRTTKHTDFEQVETLFDISQSMILYHKSEIFWIFAIEWNTTPWMSTTLLHDRASKLSKAEVHVYSDSVALSWKDARTSFCNTEVRRANWDGFMNSKDSEELNGIDGEPVEFEWSIFQDALLHEIQRKMAKKQNLTCGIQRSSHHLVDVQ